MKLSETVFGCLAVATFTLVVETTAIIVLEGTDYVVLVRQPRVAVDLWFIYAGCFLAAGIVAWALTWTVKRRAVTSGRWVLALLLAVLALPVVNGTVESRPSLERFLSDWRVILAATVVALSVAWWLVRAAARNRARPFVIIVVVLMAGIFGLPVVNAFIVLRLADQIVDPAGIRDVALAVSASWLLATPLVISLWYAGRRPVVKRLALATGYAIALYGGIIAFTPTRLPAVSRAERVAFRSPSILLIVIDTLRVDVVSRPDTLSGLTPNIASLARDGVWFENAFATSSWTTPSFGSILTSAYPSQHQAGRRDPKYNFQYPLTHSLPTLAEIMRDAGYFTGAVVTNPQLGRRFRLDRGFDVYRTLVPARTYHPVLTGLIARGLTRGGRRAYIEAERETPRIDALIEHANRSRRPFFILAHYMDPHTPYSAPENVATVPTNHETMFDRYRAEAAYCDNYLGELIRRLKEKDIYDDLLIILTADHGEEFYEGRLGAREGKRWHDHGHTLFNELIHVPLVVKYPGNVGAGDMPRANVSLIDVAPTILDLSGLAAPEDFVGRSLARQGRRAEPRMLFAEGLMYGPEQKALIHGHSKLILEKLPPSDEHASLYDLSLDANEVRPTPLDPTRKLHVELFERLESFALSGGFPADSTTVEADPHVLRQLRSLGYVR